MDEEGAKALQEYFVSCSVIITSESPGFQHGTGVAVRYGDQDYIVTAAHVLDGEPSNEKIIIIGRSDSALKELHKRELPTAFFGGTHGKIKSSRGTHIPIIERLASTGPKDIAAIRIQDAKRYLPHTVFHDLSGQDKADTSEGKPVVICGCPGELALHAKHKLTGQRGVAVSAYFAWHTISKPPKRLDPKVDFVTDFIHTTDTCDPKGMSGSGVWTIPKIREGTLWSPQQTQLIGIQSGVDRTRNLLGCVQIGHVIDLLSEKHLSKSA